MRILGIETSCDETAAAVVEASSGKRLAFRVLSNVVASQVKIHAKTGGVVPEVAARAHAEAIIPIVRKALHEAGIRSQASGRRVDWLKSNPETLITNVPNCLDVIAVTAGPGLATSLLVGVEVARTLAWLWKKPLVAVNHLEGHAYANWLPSPQPSPTMKRSAALYVPPSGGQAPALQKWQGGSNVKFPALCLIVSGGHTELVLMRKHLDYKIIGETRDDAAGEAFDKVAKMLGLGYPGGPAVAALAEKFRHTRHSERNEESRSLRKGRDTSATPGATTSVVAGRATPQDDTAGVIFPRPMIDSPNFDFSFSGLKTAVLYYVRDLKKQNKMRPHGKLLESILAGVCASFEQAVVDVLVTKTVRAAKKYKVKTVMLGGGVAANARLRQSLVEAMKRHCLSSVVCLPDIRYTTDNAVMIAAVGYFHALKKDFISWDKLDIDPNWQLGKNIVGY